uniref:Uncharacterized protein n=1 Tax=Streptomyces avermitilis TaxID=33903 RepID=A0A499V4S5_STRAX|nr:hypothetical protein SAVMC3_00370 [Streptomyces avermitilis]
MAAGAVTVLRNVGVVVSVCHTLLVFVNGGPTSGPLGVSGSAAAAARAPGPWTGGGLSEPSAE